MSKSAWSIYRWNVIGTSVLVLLVATNLIGLAQDKRSESKSQVPLQPCLDYGRSFLNT